MINLSSGVQVRCDASSKGCGDYPHVVDTAADTGPHRPRDVPSEPGRTTLSAWISGLPIIMLTTTGARSSRAPCCAGAAGR